LCQFQGARWESITLKMNQPKRGGSFHNTPLNFFFEKEQTVSNFKISVNFTKKSLDFIGIQRFFRENVIKVISDLNINAYNSNNYTIVTSRSVLPSCYSISGHHR